MSFFKKIKDKFVKNDTEDEEILIEDEAEHSKSIVEEEVQEQGNSIKDELPVAENVLEESVNTIEEKKENILNDVQREENVETEEQDEVKTEKKSFFKKILDKTSNIVKSSFDFEKIKEGLTKTRKSFSDNLRKVLGVGRKIDAALLDDIEELLITSDIGVDTTEQIIKSLKERIKKENFENSEDLYKILKEEISKILITSSSTENDRIYEIPEGRKPYVILVIGVNGVGKTTTIGKLAYNYKQAGKEVIIGASDTFRAAANEQLEIWAERAGVDIVQQNIGADPAAVAYDTLKSAQAKNKDVVIIDTAGRLHNKTHLMSELDKISRVLKKLKDTAPDEVYLVLDATTGQNAILQAKEFEKVAPITGIVLTKLDGTAKGGVVIPIANELKIPVRYIGVGEKVDDLQVFSVQNFVDALFETEETADQENPE